MKGYEKMRPFGGEDAESYYDEGLTASVKGDVALAVHCFEKAIELNDSFPAAYQQLAKCCLRMGQTDRAVTILRQVVAAEPGLIPAKLDLGHALLSLGHANEARRQFLEILEAQADNARADLGLATVCFLEGNWHGAVALAQNARAQGGDNFATMFLLGRAAKLARNADLAAQVLKEADALLEKSVELNPDQPEGYFLRGEVAFVQEQFATALEHYRAADDRAENGKVYTTFGEQFGRVDIMAKRGLSLQRLGKIEQARQVGQRIVQSDPNHKIGQALKAL